MARGGHGVAGGRWRGLSLVTARLVSVAMEVLRVQVGHDLERCPNDLSSHPEAPDWLLAFVDKAVPKAPPCVQEVGQVVIDEALTPRPHDQRAERGLLLRPEP